MFTKHSEPWTLNTTDRNTACWSPLTYLGDHNCSSHDLLRKWSNSRIKALTLPREREALFDLAKGASTAAGGGAAYSRMTFLRHFVPQMLLKRGYPYSVSIDPDTLCVRAWDLRVLLRVELIGGRPVGTNARTEDWLQQSMGKASDSGQQAELATAKNKESMKLMMKREMNLTTKDMEKRTELNGGLLIFNNSATASNNWVQTLARYYNRLQHVVEGDQDLVSLVLASEPSFERYLLPTIYNYAYRRDRERLPYAVSHRLRHGQVGHFKSSGTRGEIINVHFVLDGKPWQRQQLGAYPLWLLSTRLYHIRDWLKIARMMKPGLFSPGVMLTPAERKMLGPEAPNALRQGSRNEALALSTMVGDESMQRCRCFVRNLAKDQKSNRTSKMALRHASKHGTEGSSSSTAANQAVGEVSERELNAAIRQRQALLDTCCANRCVKPKNCPCSRQSEAPPADEKELCDAELGKSAKRFNCKLAAKIAGAGLDWSAANCTPGYDRWVPQKKAESPEAKKAKRAADKAWRSRLFFCKQCLVQVGKAMQEVAL